MNVLIGCESSGVVREAFRRHGHNAWSCDLQPADDEANGVQHLQGDLRWYINSEWQSGPVGWKWDLLIAHPDCTYLTNSAAWAFGDGPYHQKVKPGTLVGAARREAREEALAFVRLLMAAPVPRIAIENPVGAISTRIRPADQYIHPYEFGDNASKKTGLWLKGLPPLETTRYHQPRIVQWPRGSGKLVNRWGNQTDSGQSNLPPSDDRWKTRSKTYQGIADAMAAQWG